MIRRKREKQKKQQEKLDAEIARNKKLDEIRELVASRWPNIEAGIRRASVDGKTKLAVRTNSPINARVMVSHAKSLGWRAKRSLDSAPANPEVLIYWGRFAWFQMWRTRLSLAVFVIGICLVVLSISL